MTPTKNWATIIYIETRTNASTKQFMKCYLPRCAASPSILYTRCSAL